MNEKKPMNVTGKKTEEKTEEKNGKNRFDDFFDDPLYIALKKSLFSYRYRRWRISGHVPGEGLILDIGSGTAPVTPDLGRTVVADLSAGAMRNVTALSRAVTSITGLGFRTASFDCVLCSEVLEHVGDDLRAIRELRRVLKKDSGVLVVTVPYQKKFWAEDDEFVEHLRRYDPGELEEKLRIGGFETIGTYRLSGRLERWLTRRSLRSYRGSGPSRLLPIWCLRLINHALFLLLMATDPFVTWSQATRILVVAR